GDTAPPQAVALFVSTPPPVGSSAQRTGTLNPTWRGDTLGWDLFTSPATGQSGVIFSYDPETRTAAVFEPWTVSPDAFTCYQIYVPQQRGAARGGTETTLQLSTAASSKNDAYTGCEVLVTSGPGEGQLRRIAAYRGDQRVATVDEAWTIVPVAGAGYEVRTLV